MASRSLEALALHGIGLEEPGNAAFALDGLGPRFACFRPQIQHGHFGAGFCEALGYGPRQYAAGANDHGHFVGKIKQMHNRMEALCRAARAWQGG